MSDAAESDHNIEGRMHIAWIIKGGPLGHPGGGIVTKNKQQPGVVADSVPVGELHAQLQCSKDAVNLRHFAEELANRTEGNTILEDTTIYSSPPTFLGQDNKSIQSITNIEGGKGKALRRESRIINHCLSLSKQRLIAPVNVATADQIADPGTKRWVNAVKFWRMASQIFGPHQSINDILSVLERSQNSTSELVEQEAQVALVSTVSNLSDSVNYVEGNMFTNIFGSSDKMNDSTVSDDDNLEEERIYNNLCSRCLV